MNLLRLKKLNDSALRGAFCAVWVFGIIFAFYEFLYAITADSGSPEQRTFAEEFQAFKAKTELNPEIKTEIKTEPEKKEVKIPLQPLGQQIKCLDNLIIFILRFVTKNKKLKFIPQHEIDFMVLSAGTDANSITIIPTGKQMFYITFAMYYLSKLVK